MPPGEMSAMDALTAGSSIPPAAGGAAVPAPTEGAPEWNRNRDSYGRFTPGGTSPAQRRSSPSAPSSAPIEGEMAGLSEARTATMPRVDERGLPTDDDSEQQFDVDIIINTDRGAIDTVQDTGRDVRIDDTDSTSDKPDAHDVLAVAVDDDSGNARIIAYDTDGDGSIDSATIDSDDDGKMDKVVQIDEDGEVSREISLSDDAPTVKVASGSAVQNGRRDREASIADAVESDLQMLGGGGLRFNNGASGGGKQRRQGSRRGFRRIQARPPCPERRQAGKREDVQGDDEVGKWQRIPA